MTNMYRHGSVFFCSVALDREQDQELHDAGGPVGFSVAANSATEPETPRSSVPETTQTCVPTYAPELPRRHTRSRSGIINEKEYKGGTIRYDKIKRAFLTSMGSQPIYMMHLLVKIGRKLWIVNMRH